MTTTPAPEKYSDEMLDIILNHAISPACCAPKSSLREYIPTLVAMAKHGQKSRNAYTTNLVAERDALKEKVWVATNSTQHWVEVAASRTHELESLKKELLDAKTEIANIDMTLSNRSALDGCTSRSGKVGLACKEAGRYHDLAGQLEAQVKVLLAQLEESRLRKHSLETENEACAKDHTDLRDLFRGLSDRFLLDNPTLRMKVVHIISENNRLTKVCDDLKIQLELALASERDKVNRVILHKQENTALKQELLEAKAELLRLQEYFNLQRALEEASAITAVTGELKHSLYVLERTDGSIVTRKDEGFVRVLVLKSFNAACDAIEAMRKPKYPHPSYHITLVTEAQVKQLKSQIPLLLSAGEPLRLAPSAA